MILLNFSNSSNPGILLSKNYHFPETLHIFLDLSLFLFLVRFCSFIFFVSLILVVFLQLLILELLFDVVSEDLRKILDISELFLSPTNHLDILEIYIFRKGSNSRIKRKIHSFVSEFNVIQKHGVPSSKNTSRCSELLSPSKVSIIISSVEI